MALKSHKLAAATTVAAAFSLLATPVAALDPPRPAAVQAYDGDALDAQRDRHRRWGRNNVGVGDVVAGVAILGVIAAIAGAGRNRRDRDRYEQRYPLPDDNSGYRTQGDYDRGDSRGIGRAVDMCVGEVERGADRVGSVDAATRSAEGWHVSGQLESGATYSCTIGNDGRIGDVFVGDQGAAYEPSNDSQWGDDYYTSARASQGSAEPYPSDDGRYDASQVPDLEQ